MFTKDPLAFFSRSLVPRSLLDLPPDFIGELVERIGAWLGASVVGLSTGREGDGVGTTFCF